MTHSPTHYTGHVQPSGPSATRQLDHMSITKVSVGPMDNNAYVLTCRDTGKQMIIDAAAQPGRLLELVDPTRVVALVTTHSHPDHWAHGLGAVRAACPQARTYTGAQDASAIGVPTDVPVHHGELISCGHLRLSVIALRGHTPGSIALLYPDPADSPRPGSRYSHHLWTGDSLFPGGPGKTTNAHDFTTLMDDLQACVFDALPDATWVYPGHGDDTILAIERPHLPTWRTRGW